MLRYVLNRLAWGVLTVACVLTLVFALVFVANDPAVATLGNKATPEQLADFRAKHGLDVPLTSQFLGYVGIAPCVRRASSRYLNDQGERGHCGLLQGDLGESYAHHESVAHVILNRLPRTLLLGLMTLAFEMFFGILAGVLAAIRRGGVTDAALMSATYAGISLPTYITGPIALFVFAYCLGWFPVGGYGESVLDHVRHGVLPALVLAIGGAAGYARLMRGEMIEALGADHVRAARAKGLTPARVVLAHVLRNALVPVATLLGLSLPALVGGAIITEKIFAWPGLGLLTIEAIHTLDAPVIMAVVLMFGLSVQVGNLIADVLVAWLDPRVRNSIEA